MEIRSLPIFIYEVYSFFIPFVIFIFSYQSSPLFIYFYFIFYYACMQMIFYIQADGYSRTSFRCWFIPVEIDMEMRVVKWKLGACDENVKIDTFLSTNVDPSSISYQFLDACHTSHTHLISHTLYHMHILYTCSVILLLCFFYIPLSDPWFLG